MLQKVLYVQIVNLINIFVEKLISLPCFYNYLLVIILIQNLVYHQLVENINQSWVIILWSSFLRFEFIYVGFDTCHVAFGNVYNLAQII